jgi:hypothetical protein
MKQKQAKIKNQVSIGTFVRLKPYSVGGGSPSGMDHRLEIHNDFAREGGKMQYNVETVDVEDQGRIIKRDLLHVTVPPDVDPGLVHYNNGAGGIQYEFDKVFDTDASQEHVFDEVVAPKVQDVLSGVNCTVFAYGQTGSGKTFTVSGGDSFDDRGLIPRTIAMVFSELNARQKLKQFRYRCQISYTEVYVFCSMLFLPSFLSSFLPSFSYFVMSPSVSLSPIYCCLPACLPAFSDTTWHESNHHSLPPSINQSSIVTTLSFLITLQVLRQAGRQ